VPLTDQLCSARGFVASSIHCCLAETDACVALLVKHQGRHGTVLLGLYVSRENGGATLQKNFNAGELRYVRNIPGGRRQRASAAATSELTSGLLRTSAYMALAQEDRHPITDIMRQTPEIPSGAQWAIFLRNHDEMTLAMVTSKERDYLWSFYAADPRARINLC
jgi:hypothetical protein